MFKNTLPKIPYLVDVIHVFHWGPGGGTDRRPLSEGTERWRRYLTEAESAERDLWVFLEFVQNDSLDNLYRDVRTLHAWIQ